MSSIRLTKHRRGALRMRLSPRMLTKLQELFNEHSFWAVNRTKHELRQMLNGSDAVVCAWEGRRLVGFGRATSDGVFRAVLWDVVVAESHQGQGLGRLIVEGLLTASSIVNAERIYLMTTNGQKFYEKLGFKKITSQRLMMKR